MQGVLAAPGTGILSTAKMLAAELETSPRPATRILQEHSGLTLRLDSEPPASRPLEDDEQARLDATGQCISRAGWLRHGRDVIAADVTFTWLPGRMPAGACVELAHTNTPAGLILARYGMIRTDRRAMALTEYMAGGTDVAVRASAVIVVRGWLAAIATEEIPRAFVELIALR